jgi:hypothetical protein
MEPFPRAGYNVDSSPATLPALYPGVLLTTAALSVSFTTENT